MAQKLDDNVQTIKSGKVLVLWLGEKCNMVLKEDSIFCEHLTPKPYNLFATPLEDVIGLRVLKVPSSTSSTVCRAELFTYKKEKKFLSKKLCRKLIKEVIEFSECDDFDTNYKTALEWREAIQLQRMKRNSQIFVSTPERVDKPPEPLRLLVIINPFSGRKKSEELYRTVCLPLFEIAGIEIVHELITERQGHAREFIETFDLSKITGIVCASGDGILYEIVNGLMARPDWKMAIKVPIGPLPTGSGNALVSSLIFEANEGEGDALLNAISLIINGGIQPHDIASVMTESSGLMYMTVILNWAMIGAVDIESERLRILGGELRNIIGGLIAIVRKKEYRGRLSYLPIQEEDRENEGDISSLPNISLSDPVPDNWITTEEDFIVFSSMTCPSIANDVIGQPDLKVGSGEQWILCASPNVTRMQLISKISDASSLGTNFYTIRTKAFRLTPLTPGIISIDGERIEYGTLQVQVLPGMMRLFSRKRT